MLKPFPFAGDGHTVEWLVAGLERDFGAAATGLFAEGFIDSEGGALDAIQSSDEQPALIEPETTALAGAPENATLKRGRRR